ncbi:MAG: hypothetical protein ACREX3_00290 [Gammaproteobacteria bacterium]
MFRSIAAAGVGILVVIGGAVAGLALATRFPVECIGVPAYASCGHPYISIAVGPLVGFVGAGFLVRALAKRYRHLWMQGRSGGQAA